MYLNYATRERKVTLDRRTDLRTMGKNIVIKLLLFPPHPTSHPVLRLTLHHRNVIDTEQLINTILIPNN